MNLPMNKIIDFIKNYWPSAITLAVVLYATLCSDPLGDSSMPPIPHLDKLIHAVMMGGLYGAIVFDRQRSDRSRRFSAHFLLMLAACVVAFSALDEVAQYAMGLGRSGDELDFVADCVGVIVAFFTAPAAVRKVLGV